VKTDEGVATMNDDVGRPDAAPGDETGTSLATTGDPRVDQALQQLQALDRLDVDEHPARFDDIHRALAAALDESPAAEPPRQ
jgi:hypothetical protein